MRRPLPFSHRRHIEARMQLSQLDADDLFSLTMWRSADGFTVGVQKHAGDLVKYETRRTASEAIIAALKLLHIAPPPY